MRKWIAVFVILLLVLLCAYWLIPGKTNVHQKTIVPVNTRAFAREILDEQKWQQWWPGKQTRSSSFKFKENTYRLEEKKLSSLMITINNGTDSLSTELIFVPLQSDSIELSWNGIKNSNTNPLHRLQNLSWTKNLDADINLLLQKIRSFYSNEDNLYGFHIEKALVADSNLISTSTTTRAYPTTEVIYALVDKLRNYIQKNEAKELGYPMLNIYKNPDSFYLVRVAIPTDKKLNNSGDIQYRWMLQGGNILVTEVKGGQQQIERAFIKMENYVEDHRRIAPAIPFQSLVTDRRQEPDTNKWITKVYWPVM
jgi:hypothetical protein